MTCVGEELVTPVLYPHRSVGVGFGGRSFRASDSFGLFGSRNGTALKENVLGGCRDTCNTLRRVGRMLQVF